MFPTPFFIWTMTDINIKSRSNDDNAEEKSAALSASSVSNFQAMILSQRWLWSSKIPLLEDLSSKASGNLKVFSAFQYNLWNAVWTPLKRWTCNKSSSIKEMHWLRNHEAKQNLFVFTVTAGQHRGG